MSCGKHHGRDENCVCDAVEKILAEQEAVEEQCPTGCYTNLLSPTVTGKDTIPFLLFDKKAVCSPHSGTSEDLRMTASASSLFSSGQKEFVIAAQRFQYCAP